MIVEMQAERIVHGSIPAGLEWARVVSIAGIRRAIQLEEKKGAPRIALIRGLNAELRRKEREAAAAPKERA